MKLEFFSFDFDKFASEMQNLKDKKGFDYLVTIVGEDFGEEGLGCVYILENTKTHERLRSSTRTAICTCGGLQPNTPTGCFVASVKSIGFDGLLNYYAGRNNVCDLKLEEAFKQHMSWDPIKGAPYVSVADAELINQVAQDDMVRGYTISCGGFYGPQGRVLRADIADPKQNEKIESFEYDGMKICNFEMESSAVAGLASLLGHRAMTCCMVIANRYAQKMNTEYKNSIDTLIEKVLDRI